MCVAPISLAFSSLKGDRVHRDDRACAGDACSLDRTRPDATASDHDDRLAGLDLGPVDRRAEAGGDAAADERRRLHVGVRLDADQRILVADHLVGEGPELAHPVHVRATEVVAVRPVADHAAAQRRRAEVAQVLPARGAPVAGPTRGDERHRHVIAERDLRHVGPDLGHDARSFMPADDREHGRDADQFEHFGRRADIACPQVFVGVAHAGVDHLHPDLTVARWIDVDLFGLPRLVQSGADHRTRFHLPTLPLDDSGVVASPVSFARGRRTIADVAAVDLRRDVVVTPVLPSVRLIPFVPGAAPGPGQLTRA